MSNQPPTYFPSWASLPCPKCGAEVNQSCRTLKTKRTTDTHTARINAWFVDRGWRMGLHDTETQE